MIVNWDLSSQSFTRRIVVIADVKTVDVLREAYVKIVIGEAERLAIEEMYLQLDVEKHLTF